MMCKHWWRHIRMMRWGVNERDIAISRSRNHRVTVNVNSLTWVTERFPPYAGKSTFGCAPAMSWFHSMTTEENICHFQNMNFKCILFCRVTIFSTIHRDNFCECAWSMRRRYILTSSLIGWAHPQNDPWIPRAVFLRIYLNDMSALDQVMAWC